MRLSELVREYGKAERMAGLLAAHRSAGAPAYQGKAAELLEQIEREIAVAAGGEQR